MEETLKLLQEVSGREFADMEDFKKHYQNLSSYIGKKKEDFRNELMPEFEARVTAEVNKVKEGYVKHETFIKEAGIDLEKVNPLAIKEYIGESHQDIKPRMSGEDESAKMDKLKRLTMQGNRDARTELIKLSLGK